MPNINTVNPFDVIYSRLDHISLLLCAIQADITGNKEDRSIPNSNFQVVPKLSNAAIYKLHKEGKIQSHLIEGQEYFKKSEIIDSLTIIKKHSA